MLKTNMQKTGVGALVVMLAMALIGKWEGVSTTPYYDIGGVLTVCYGETVNVNKSDIYTKTDCEEMLAQRVPDYYHGMREHITREDVPVEVLAALTSFSYNVGINAFKQSTLLRKLNAGDFVGACMELDRWVYDNGKAIKGLANRRADEKALCLKGVVMPPPVNNVPVPAVVKPLPPPIKQATWLGELASFVSKLFE